MTVSKEKLIDVSEIAYWADYFESRSIEKLLEWAVPQFMPNIAMTSSFGAEGVVLIDHLAKIGLKIPVIYLDTGYHFAATEILKEQIQERYQFEIITQTAALTLAEQTEKYGADLYARDADQCCKMRKVEPLQQALAPLDAWLAALRRDQSPTRAGIQKVEWNAKHHLVKLNPLADWTRKDVWAYTLNHKLPYNTLYDEGYSSIGCWPCTKQTKAGEHERNGRWSGQTKLECGIHL